MAISSKDTFLLVTYWYAGLLNYLVPSGGSEWAITAPYLIEAAKQLGVSIPKTVVTDASDCWQVNNVRLFPAIVATIPGGERLRRTGVDIGVAHLI